MLCDELYNELCQLLTNFETGKDLSMPTIFTPCL